MKLTSNNPLLQTYSEGGKFKTSKGHYHLGIIKFVGYFIMLIASFMYFPLFIFLIGLSLVDLVNSLHEMDFYDHLVEAFGMVGEFLNKPKLVPPKNPPSCPSPENKKLSDQELNELLNPSLKLRKVTH